MIGRGGGFRDNREKPGKSHFMDKKIARWYNRYARNLHVVRNKVHKF